LTPMWRTAALAMLLAVPRMASAEDAGMKAHLEIHWVEGDQRRPLSFTQLYVIEDALREYAERVKLEQERAEATEPGTTDEERAMRHGRILGAEVMSTMATNLANAIEEAVNLRPRPPRQQED
jgi:hypothetical protein